MPDIQISTLFETADDPLLSYEFFPPKDGVGLETLKQTATKLLTTKPDFVTCTYGAGGSTREKTFDVCQMLRDMGFGPVMPHLTCVGSTRTELEAIADEIHDMGFRNIMTLRGDPPKGEKTFRAAKEGLSYSVELVKLLKERHGDFCSGVAGFPETHPEAKSPEQDIEYLKAKLDAGGDFVTTQLFYENDLYYDFVERCRKAGITKPILPGLLPATSLKQALRITSMCQAEFPDALATQLGNVHDDAEAATEVGVAWMVTQIKDLLANGAPGVHLYVLNRATVALEPAVMDCFDR